MSDPDFKLYLESRMTAVLAEVDELIAQHARFGDTMQKDYLYRARRALMDGLGWFDWARSRGRDPLPKTQKGPEGPSSST